jgi:hypothetical protein
MVNSKLPTTYVLKREQYEKMLKIYLKKQQAKVKKS